jgi:hypothetical protein
MNRCETLTETVRHSHRSLLFLLAFFGSFSAQAAQFRVRLTQSAQHDGHSQWTTQLRIKRTLVLSCRQCEIVTMGFSTAALGGLIGFTAQCMSNSIQKIPLSRRK